MAFLDYEGLGYFLDKLKTIFPLSSIKGQANGLAELDNSGKVPSSQLPSYVDDVEEHDTIDFVNLTEWVSGNSYVVGDKVKVTDNETVIGYVCIADNSSSTILITEWRLATKFPVTGESGKVYIDTNTNITYRWGGSVYIPIGSDLALGETSSTAYRGDRGAAAYAAAVINVENAPTLNSTNLITSGGVAAAIPVVMTGATSSTAGASGLVPAPTIGDNEKYLKGDGTWSTVEGITALYRQFWTATNEVNILLSSTANKMYAIWCTGSGATSDISDTNYGAYIVITDEKYTIVHKGTSITVTENGGMLTVTSDINIAMAIIEL